MKTKFKIGDDVIFRNKVLGVVTRIIEDEDIRDLGKYCLVRVNTGDNFFCTLMCNQSELEKCDAKVNRFHKK